MMEPRDAVLGQVAVERGWLSRDDLADCLRECAALPRDHGAEDYPSPLSKVIARRRLIPEEELEALRAEISKVLDPSGDSRRGREEDVVLGRLLRDAGQLSPQHLEEAFALEMDSAGRGGASRLREILLEKGFVTFSALQEALHAQRTPGTPLTCRSCNAIRAVAAYDPGRVYLCKVCTGELVPTADLGPPSPVPAVAPLAGPEHEFGRYGSPAEIGRGGMGVVYKAWDEIHQRWVALKVIKDSGRLEELTRFRREVEIARSLHHPNIVALHEVTHVGDRHQIAMEYVDGRTIAGLRLPPKWAAELILKIAHALQYAHSRGIVHRDIKPQNIMVDGDGKPYLVDFGLAKSAENRSSITSVGTAMGTPSYMAPEQAIGRSSRVDRRSDIYSLGAVLYDLVTGCPPFRGANPLDTLRKVVYESLVPPSQLESTLPETLERIILKCMEKDKNHRYQTAKNLADDLERFLSAITG